MKTAILNLITAIALLFISTTLFAQGKGIYMMKNGSVVFQSAVSDIDSIVFRPADFTEKINEVDLDMVYVKGGTYQRGCSTGDAQCESTEKPVHSVTLSDYWVAKYEVTQDQWWAVMGGTRPASGNQRNIPQTGITWYDAIEFTCKLREQTGKNYRLLTDAEFEYAARGGSKSKGYLYSGSNNASEVARYSGNTSGCSGYGACTVGSLAPNELGLYDMSGNVYEWMYDSWGNYNDNAAALTNPINNPTAHTQKVRRGGSYDQPASESRVSGRKIRSIEGKDGSIGFRLALSLSDSDPAAVIDPCAIHPPESRDGKKGFRDLRLITADDEVWVYEYNYGGMEGGNMLIVNENGASLISRFFTWNNQRQWTTQASGEWYTLNNFSLNIVQSSGAAKKYIYYLVDDNNMTMMPEGDMPSRWVRKRKSEVLGSSSVNAPTIANPKTPEQLAPAGYNIDMSNPPTTGRDPSLIEGPNNTWLQDNVALGAGGTHRYRWDFDSEDFSAFYVYDASAGSVTSLSRGSWFTVDNNFLRVIDANGCNYDYLYTVTSDGKTYYHISFQSYEQGDFRMFEKVTNEHAVNVGAWKAPTGSVSTYNQGCSTYTPPSD
jgi:formylglycine-generating enzyme required for sulfatase activity